MEPVESIEALRIRVQWELEELVRLIFSMPTINAKTVFVVGRHRLS